VADASRYNAIVQEAIKEGKSLLLLIERDKHSRFVVLALK